jgi:hypothetical protein
MQVSLFLQAGELYINFHLRKFFRIHHPEDTANLAISAISMVTTAAVTPLNAKTTPGSPFPSAKLLSRGYDDTRVAFVTAQVLWRENVTLFGKNASKHNLSNRP